MADDQYNLDDLDDDALQKMIEALQDEDDTYVPSPPSSPSYEQPKSAPPIQVYSPPAATASSYSPSPPAPVRPPSPVPAPAPAPAAPQSYRSQHNYTSYQPPKSFVPQTTNYSSPSYDTGRSSNGAKSVADLARKFGGPSQTSNSRKQQQAEEKARLEAERQREEKEKEMARERERQHEQQRRADALQQQEREWAAKQASASYRSSQADYSKSSSARNNKLSPQERALFVALEHRTFKSAIPPAVILRTFKKQPWFDKEMLTLCLEDEVELTKALKKVGFVTKKIYLPSTVNDDTRHEQQVKQHEMENSRQSLLPSDTTSKQPSSSVAVPVPYSSEDVYNPNLPAVLQDYDEGCYLCCCIAQCLGFSPDPYNGRAASPPSAGGPRNPNKNTTPTAL